MPLRWDQDPAKTDFPTPGTPPPLGGGALAHAVLWPHRSLPRKGMAGVIGFAFVMILIPTLPLLGTPVLWGLLPFTLGAVCLLWFFLERSYASGALREDLTLWPDKIEIVRTNPRGPEQRWAANPFWVRLSLIETGGPVENYVTLNGNGREVELGAFLSPHERAALHNDLQRLLARLSR